MFDALIVDKCAARGIKVEDHMSAFEETDLGVLARNARLVDDQVVIQLAANIDDVFLDSEDLGAADDEEGAGRP